MADYLTRLDFVVLDELGYLPFAQAGGQLLFHLVSRLYERDNTGLFLGTDALIRTSSTTASTCRDRIPSRLSDGAAPSGATPGAFPVIAG